MMCSLLHATLAAGEHQRDAATHMLGKVFHARRDQQQLAQL
jgi:hypothetical protein